MFICIYIYIYTAAVHAARAFLSNLEDGHLIIKLDFRNAFNSIRRDKMLHSVLMKAPELLPFAYCSYQHPSLLFFGILPSHPRKVFSRAIP